jgi:hypothetical protein
MIAIKRRDQDRRVEGIASRPAAPIHPVPCFALIPQYSIRCRSRELLTAPKDPDALLLPQGGCRTRRPQGHLLPFKLQLKRVPGVEVQFVAHRFWNDQAARLIQCHRGIHNGILP